MAEQGNIKNYRKDKGFEIIPRDFLQDDQLSLQAIGLLSNLQSYPDTWVLHKTEVYKRFKKNGKTSVANAWEELVKEQYIVQLRRRNGKKWDYVYYFNLERFTDEQVKELEEQEQAVSMSFRFSEAQKNSQKSWASENEKPKMGIPKSEDKKDNIQESTQRDTTQNNLESLESLELREEEEEKEYITRAREGNFAYEILSDYFREKLIDERTIDKIIGHLIHYKLDIFSLENVEKQFNHMMQKEVSGQRIYDFPYYFANGLKDLTRQSKVSNNYLRERLLRIEQNKRQNPTARFYNWLEDRD